MTRALRLVLVAVYLVITAILATIALPFAILYSYELHRKRHQSPTFNERDRAWLQQQGISAD